MLELGGADDGRGYAGCLQNPGAGDLRGADAALLCEFLYGRQNLEIALAEVHPLGEFIGLRAGGISALVGGGAIAGQKSARQRAPRDESHTLVDAERIHLALLLAIDQVV